MPDVFRPRFQCKLSKTHTRISSETHNITIRKGQHLQTPFFLSCCLLTFACLLRTAFHGHTDIFEKLLEVISVDNPNLIKWIVLHLDEKTQERLMFRCQSGFFSQSHDDSSESSNSEEEEVTAGLVF